MKGGIILKRTLLILFLAVFILAGCVQDNIAFSVNGIDVERAELVYHMERLVDVTVADIYSEYGVDYDYENLGFWDTEISESGETPMEILKQRAVDETVRNKIILYEARKYGIVSELQFSNQMSDWRKDNQQRKNAADAGETVYGVVERDFYTYASTCFLEAQKKLQEKLKEKKITVTEAEIKEYYVSNPDYFEGDKYEDVKNSIYGWIFDEKYEKYIDGLVSKAEISYKNMQVKLDEIL